MAAASRRMFSSVMLQQTPRSSVGSVDPFKRAAMPPTMTNSTPAACSPSRSSRSFVDPEGRISLPWDVRHYWVHLGSNVVSEDSAPGKGFTLRLP